MNGNNRREVRHKKEENTDSWAALQCKRDFRDEFDGNWYRI